MLFFLTRHLILRRFRTVASFESPDPWQGGVRGEFTLEGYKLVPKGVDSQRALSVYAKGGREFLGLRAERDGSEKLLPESLAALYRAGRAPAHEVPRLLHAIEGRVARNDWRPTPPVPPAASLAVLAVIGLLGASTLPTAWKETERSRMAREARRNVLEAESWLAEPAPPGSGATVAGDVTLAGSVPVPALEAHPELRPPASGLEALGWVETPSGARAVLVPRGAETPVRKEPDVVTRARQRIGLPSPAADGRRRVTLGRTFLVDPKLLGLGPALAELKNRVPSLDLSVVACPQWEPAAFGSGQTLFLKVFLSGSAVLAAVPISIAVLTLVLPRDLRRRRQTRELEALLGGPYVVR